MTGLRPIAELMFSDFFAVTWDMVVNQIAKTRYMTDGQVSLPLVLRTANGAGLRFGAQHSQSVENWAMAIPGLKVVAPSTPADVVGPDGGGRPRPGPGHLLRAQGALRRSRARSRTARRVDALGTARIVRAGADVTIVALAAMVPKARRGRRTTGRRARHRRGGHRPALARPARHRGDPGLGREDEPAVHGRGEPARCCGWGAEIASIVADEGFYSLDAPIVRITTPHIPLPSAAALEDLAIPSVDRIVDTVKRRLDDAA